MCNDIASWQSENGLCCSMQYCGFCAQIFNWSDEFNYVDYGKRRDRQRNTFARNWRNNSGTMSTISKVAFVESSALKRHGFLQLIRNGCSENF